MVSAEPITGRQKMLRISRIVSTPCNKGRHQIEESVVLDVPFAPSSRNDLGRRIASLPQVINKPHLERDGFSVLTDALAGVGASQHVVAGGGGNEEAVVGPASLYALPREPVTDVIGSAQHVNGFVRQHNKLSGAQGSKGCRLCGFATTERFLLLERHPLRPPATRHHYAVCNLTARAYIPPLAIRSSCVPSSAISPSLRT